MNFSQQAKECNYQTCCNFGWLIPITNYYNVTSYITVVTLRKKNQILATRISEMAGAIFFKLECGLPYLAGTSVATLVSIG